MATFTQLASGNWRVQVRRKTRYVAETFRRRKDGEEWALEMERNIDRNGSSKPRVVRNVRTFGDLIDLHDEDMREVGRPPRRSKAAVMASLKTELGSVKLPALNRERLIEFGRKRAKQGAGHYNLLYRWFVGLSPDDPVWDPTTFTKNRDRLQNGEVFAKFMTRLLNHPEVKPLLSDEHFSVDETLIEAWASQKSFRPKDGSGNDDDGANFYGQKRKNDTHASTSDPDSRLYRKAAGREAKLCYMGHATMENRHGLAVAGMVTHANGTAERRASEIMLKARGKAAGHRITGR